MTKILVTGGAGFIGTHMCVQLLREGYTTVVVDNLSNSSAKSLDRVRRIVGEDAGKLLSFHLVDLLDKDKLEKVFEDEGKFDACIHFAGLKAVGESVAEPLRYYRTNLQGTFNLIELLLKFQTPNLVFSSSATVYGSSPPPLSETSQVGIGITNPYGQTKFMIERILQDVCKANASLNVSVLRYFNPVGADATGLIGENPLGKPNNLMPYVTQVAVGIRPQLTVFGDDYDTRDGTGVRDFIHVVDLAEGHLAALRTMDAAGSDADNFRVFNLGTGDGCSVLEMVEAMKKASGKEIPYVIGPRRPGDLAEVVADSSKAKAELGWEAKRGVADMCQDAWKWQSENPKGYEE
eukprot:g2716.t1